MRGVVLLAALAVLVSRPATGQVPAVLRITVVVLDAAQQAVPAARHALLISDNPPTTTPRRVVTDAEGKVEVRLAPGNYTVESDHPYAWAGRAYQWIETLDVSGGAPTVLALTDRNAEIVPLTDAIVAASAPPAVALAERLPPWKDSLVALWTPTRRATGFVVDASGLILTSQRIAGDAATIEVQVSPSVTVEGRVLATDVPRDVAVIWVDAAAVSSLAPVPLPCGQPAAPLAGPDDRDVVALGVPLRATHDRIVRGTVRYVAAQSLDVDLRLPAGAIGGPLLTEDGVLIGMTSPDDDPDARRRDVRAVPIAHVCEVVSAAQQKMSAASRPAATRRPVQPAAPFPPAALADAVKRGTGTRTPYRATASDFEVAFITPVMVYAAQQPDRRTTSADTRNATADRMRVPPWSDFGTWSDYVTDVPPVLLVRVTPKLSQGFWTAIARGAAMTQGVNLPAIKRFASALTRLRAYCGDNEVIPIHALRLESRIIERETVVEGLYAFDPGAFGPHCAGVKLEFYAEKDPGRGDTKTIDATVVQQIWQDFEPYRRP